MKREAIKSIAIGMVKESGIINLSRKRLCDAADIPEGSFKYHMDCTFTDFISELKKLQIDSKTHVILKQRIDPKLRKDQILNAAVKVAKSHGYNNVTGKHVADDAGVSLGLVSHHFETMKQLKRAIIRSAIKNEIVEIVAQGLANNDAQTAKAPKELKVKAALLIANR